MSDIRALEKDLNEMILAGKAMEAFEKYYADDCVMRENNGEPRVGKDACRDYEVAFFGNIAEFHGAKLLHGAAEGDRSYSEWVFDCTMKDGNRVTNSQVAARKWRDGQVVEERFYYEPNIRKA